MLSICIPTYNYCIKSLVTKLSELCCAEKIEFEIIILEDGSDENHIQQNECINKISGVKYLIEKENQGRSVTRNRLADTAKYDKILFIDCDSEIPNNDYIKNYIRVYQEDIVCGGTLYTEKQYNPQQSLRYTFGISREMLPVEKRNKNFVLTTNNLMMSKYIFKDIRFCEFLKKYGHEDSLLGFELKKAGFQTKHIYNPVIHIGIENNNIFLRKTEAGIQNLLEIKKQDEIDSDFILEIRLYRMFLSLQKYKLTDLIYLFFSLTKNKLEKYLIESSHPKLVLFDFYKIGYFIEAVKTAGNGAREQAK